MRATKFNIGDLAKVVKKDPEDFCWISSMDKMIGKTYEVASVTPRRTRLGGFWFKNTELKLVKASNSKRVRLNSEYTVTVLPFRKVVKVGCQTFTFKKIQQLAKLCK